MNMIKQLSFLIITFTAFSTISYAQEASIEVAKTDTEISDINKASLDELINHIESNLEITQASEPNGDTAIANVAIPETIAINKMPINNTATNTNSSTASDSSKTATEVANTVKTQSNEESSKKSKISLVEVLQLGASLASLLMSAYL